ncbi:MAG: TIGR03943 family protein [Chloroflexi bacterium]|nr:TIGR03943 family protein [Chloroflexota bacterium]
MTAFSGRRHDARPHAERIAWAKTALLLGMGLYFSWLIISGNLSNYINQRFAWLAVVGAAVFILLALVNLYGSLRSADECGHQHYEIGWDILLIVATPLLLALLIPSRSLGIEAVNGGISLSPVGVASPAAFQRSPLDRNILDWLREFDRASSPAAFNGIAADVIGFVYREPSFSDEQFMISRFTMSCCVADAFPIGLPVSASAAPDFETGVWARVRGELEAADFGGDFMPVLFADTIEEIDEPRQPYLYP